MRKLIPLLIFGAAMGFFEFAVVYYLRLNYYPNGFYFPLAVIPDTVIIIELLREAATIVMLVTLAVAAGTYGLEKFAYLIFCFGVWDIFYYVFLKIFLDWPETLLTWDILFLIPVPWTGPVLAPVIVSITMIIVALIIVYQGKNGRLIRTRPVDWVIAAAGGLMIIFSFTWDHLRPDVLEFSKTFVPVRFPWWVFIIGEILAISAFCRAYFFSRRMKNK
jgi:hypothetical protein